jgi:hypothetical protein
MEKWRHQSAISTTRQAATHSERASGRHPLVDVTGADKLSKKLCHDFYRTDMTAIELFYREHSGLGSGSSAIFRHVSGFEMTE